MWIWLDKTGKVQQYLMHGNSPIVGETDFEIFAYFDGLDINFFDEASIKFRKPDRQGSTYPILFMKKVDMIYKHMSMDGDSSKFNENDSPYTGFLFKFSDFAQDEEVVRLLDTPGLWEATITCLGGSNKTNVSGLITFSVGKSASDSEDESELTLDQVLQNLILSQNALPKSNIEYIRIIDNFVSKAQSGGLDVNSFVVGASVLDKTTQRIYELETVTINPSDDTKVSATYKTIMNFLSVDGGTMLGSIDMNGHEISNLKYPVNSLDAANKKYVDDHMETVSTTWNALKTLRDNSQLIKGATYRITDYYCSTIQAGTQSENNQFDILVVADDINKLNENAHAIMHDGDTHFVNANLEAWELKYCLDNDIARFAWADASGKGVIFYMKDEFNNEAPYDFQNILFARYKITAGDNLTSLNELYLGTDSSAQPYGTDSVSSSDVQYIPTFYGDLGTFINNVIKPFVYGTNILQLNNITLSSEYLTEKNACSGNIFEYGCYDIAISKGSRSNVFETNCHNIVLGKNTNQNTFSDYCSNITLACNCQKNTFGNDCSSISIGNESEYNKFGDLNRNNKFGNSNVGNILGYGCYSNTFGNNCYYNTFGNSCYHNTFGNYCYGNVLGNNCLFNSFGNDCSYNTFGNICYSNTFGNNCSSNTLLDNATSNERKAFANWNIFDNGVQYVILTASDSGSSSNCLQNIHIHSGVQGTSSSKKTITVARNLSYSTDIYATDSEISDN